MSTIETKPDGLIDRRTFVDHLVANRGDDLCIVAGLGSPCYDLKAAGDHPLNFYLYGAMGGAVPMAMGLAAAQPEKRVMALTGDGEVLMGLTGLAAAGAEGLENLIVVVLDNERYGETGPADNAYCAWRQSWRRRRLALATGPFAISKHRMRLQSCTTGSKRCKAPPALL